MSAAEVTVSTEDFAGRPLDARETQRLKSNVFQTRYEPLQDETKAALRGWKPPKHAYVLFERWQMETLPDTTRKVRHGVMPLNVEGRPEQFHKIEFYLRKGFRIIHWDNFHFVTDKNEESARIANMYSNAWAKLEQELLRCVEANKTADELKSAVSENDALKKRLAEYESKVAKSKPAVTNGKEA